MKTVGLLVLAASALLAQGGSSYPWSQDSSYIYYYPFGSHSEWWPILPYIEPSVYVFVEAYGTTNWTLTERYTSVAGSSYNCMTPGAISGYSSGSPGEIYAGVVAATELARCESDMWVYPSGTNMRFGDWICQISPC
jgi:hypothetical protein